MPPRPRWIKQRRRLDHKITIMRAGTGTNEFNEPDPNAAPVAVFTTRAAAYPSPGIERYDAAQNVASTFVTFEVRDEARARGILPTDQIRWDSRGNQMFNIVAPVEQPERGSNLRITTAADRT